MADKKIAELANDPSVKAAASSIHSAGSQQTQIIDLIAETKAGGSTLTATEAREYNDILHKFSETKDRSKLKTFTDALRGLNGEDETTRAHIAGALLVHGAKTGRDGISLMADVLVHVHGAQDIQFKANVPNSADPATGLSRARQITLPITALMQSGTLDDSRDLHSWNSDAQEYLSMQLAHAQASAHKNYPREYDTKVTVTR